MRFEPRQNLSSNLQDPLIIGWVIITRLVGCEQSYCRLSHNLKHGLYTRVVSNLYLIDTHTDRVLQKDGDFRVNCNAP